MARVGPVELSDSLQTIPVAFWKAVQVEESYPSDDQRYNGVDDDDEDDVVDAEAEPHAARSIVAAATPIDVVAVRDFRLIFRFARNMSKKLGASNI